MSECSMEESDALKDTCPTSQMVSTVSKEGKKYLISNDFCIEFLQNPDNITTHITY